MITFLRSNTVTSATTPEIAANRVLSVSNWRMRRVRLAPIVKRIAISRRRDEERAKTLIEEITRDLPPKFKPNIDAYFKNLNRLYPNK